MQSPPFCKVVRIIFLRLLAVNNVFTTLRLTPGIQQVYPLKEVLKEIKSWDFGRQRRVSFEYILFKNFNDSVSHVNELSRILHGIRCRINLIRFHPIPDTPLESPDEETIGLFKEKLSAKGIVTTIRASRGQDIWAACGLLSTKKLADK